MTQYDVLLIGRTPVSAILARRLAVHGRSVALIDDGMTPDTTGSIRWVTLRDLGLADRPGVDSWPRITAFCERVLLEDGVLETVYRSERFDDLAHRTLLTHLGELVDAILAGSVPVDHGSSAPIQFLIERGRVTGARFADGSEINARLSIVTSDNRRLLGAKDRTLPDEIAPPYCEQLEIAWPGRLDSSCEQLMVSGGRLADVEATATLHLAPGRTALSMIVSAADLVRESVVVSDVLDQLLSHAAMVDLSPLAEATSASVRLLTRPEWVDVERYGLGYAVFGAMQGFCDPASFDREIRLAQLLAGELTTAPVDRYGSVSLHCTIAAALRASEWSRREPHSRPGHIDAGDLFRPLSWLDGPLAISTRVSAPS